jgi:Acyl-ACP thioesterase
MKQIEKYIINSHDIDINGIASPSSVLRYLQETANLEHYRHGPTTDDLRAGGKAFIVSKIALNMYRPLRVYDEITVESWLCKTKAMSFLRCGRILHGSMPVAELTSVWALVDINNHRLLRADDIELGFGYDEPLEMEAPPRILLPHDIIMSLAGERSVSYGDVDLNRHMNNTNYLNMFYGFIPVIEKKSVVSAMVFYQSEAPLGETLKIYRSCNELDDVYCFRTIRPGGIINAEAIIRLDDLN